MYAVCVWEVLVLPLFLRFFNLILELFRQCGILELFRKYGILELFRQCGILELFQQCGILELFQQCGILDLFWLWYFGTVPTVRYFGTVLTVVFWNCSDSAVFVCFSFYYLPLSRSRSNPVQYKIRPFELYVSSPYHCEKFWIWFPLIARFNSLNLHVEKFVSDLREVGKCSIWVLHFHPPISPNAKMLLNYWCKWR